MNTKRKINVALFVMLSLTGYAFSDESKIKVTINDVKVEDTVYTPFYQVETEQNHEPGSASRWIRLGVYFTTEGGWIDEIDVAQLAAIKKGDTENGLMFCENVHYINIEPGDHYVYVYLHPSYVERYGIKAFDVDAAAAISINGIEVAKKETTRHYKKGWSSSEHAKCAKGYLLNHTETPFWFINYDFNEIIKRKEHAGN